MMNKQNVTLSLPKSVIGKAKIVAVRKGKSLSQFLKEALEEKIMDDSGYKVARDRQLKQLEAGFDFGTEGHITTSREDLHARK
ncbi:MAG: DUF6364 family protein [Pseudomonadota bacterium]